MESNMKQRAVIFDLDGTLLDTIEDIGNSMNSVLHRFGFEEHDVETYKSIVGEGIEHLVRRSLPEENRTNQSLLAECLLSMREEYGRRWNEKTRPYPGIPELLDTLADRGIKMAILSNKPDDMTRIVVAQLLPKWRFDAVLGARPSVPKKPDPLGALEIAELLEIRPSDFLYMGDTRIDMETANRAGMKAVGVLWGFRQAEELIAGGAKAIISTPMDLMELF
jgi:phosphoglycolate phosphatase